MLKSQPRIIDLNLKPQLKHDTNNICKNLRVSWERNDNVHVTNHYNTEQNYLHKSFLLCFADWTEKVLR